MKKFLAASVVSAKAVGLLAIIIFGTFGGNWLYQEYSRYEAVKLQNEAAKEALENEKKYEIPRSESKCRIYLGSIGRLSQAFYLQKSKFPASIAELNSGITTLEAEVVVSDSYDYKINAINDSLIQINCIPKKDNLHAYTTMAHYSDSLILGKLCESQTLTKNEPPQFTAKDNFECPSGYKLFSDHP